MNIRSLKNSIYFRFTKYLCISKIKGQKSKKQIFLTFDDGPDDVITDQVLDLLRLHNAKATFFNIGKKNVQHPTLLEKIIKEGHSIGSHTYNHLSGYATDFNTYINDVEKSLLTCNTDIFRPPYGFITFRQFRYLRKKYRIYIWNKGSNDHCGTIDDLDMHIASICTNTKSGDIILFHDTKEHADLTLKILPRYLEYLSNEGYEMKAL